MLNPIQSHSGSVVTLRSLTAAQLPARLGGSVQYEKLSGIMTPIPFLTFSNALWGTKRYILTEIQLANPPAEVFPGSQV